MKKSIGVIGQGFVGGSLTTVFAERGVDVYAFDKANVYKPGVSTWKRTNWFPSSITDLVQEVEKYDGFTGIYFVCLPTPMYEDGAADLSIVEGALQELADAPSGPRIAVVKSTVPPGSTERWNRMFNDKGLTVVHSPEFLREATAIDDQRNQTRIIVGGPKNAVKRVRQLFKAVFPTVPFIATSSSNSELTKYVTNCFLATKVSFANEIYQIVDALQRQGLDVDYDRIIECATLDERLGKSHWQVPSFEVDEAGQPLYGYSLSCFPKDVNALMSLAKNVGVDPRVLSGGWEKNKEVRPSKDWEKLEGRAVSKKT